MRENMGIYRGKTKDGEWVEGYFTKTILSNGEIIYIEEEHRLACYTEVLPDTVGEWTGMKDKNGKRIFEGDIVEEFCGVNGHREQGAVYFNDLHLQFLFGDYNSLLNCSIYERKVIGNIYDNPELVKE